jgi:hypothetical protein
MTDAPQFLTAFIVAQAPDGSWRAITDLAQPFVAEAPATRNDILVGTRELSEYLLEDRLIDQLVSRLQENNVSDSTRTAASIRHALHERKSNVTTGDPE